MSDSQLTILAISDLHYTGLSRQTAQMVPCRGELARTLLKKVFLRLQHEGTKPDVVVVLGDLTEDREDPNAQLDMISLHGELVRCGLPVIVLPGNHDIDPAQFNECFNTPPGIYRYNGYGLVVLNDHYGDAHECTRGPESFQLLKRIRAENPDSPLGVLQHAPIYPPIDSNYPYRPVNVGEIIESYEKNGVILSLSGHYHTGQKARVHNDILYHTVAALCEPPFNFSLIRLNGTKIEIQEESLQLTTSNITDFHCHTEFAFCGTTIDSAPAIALSRTMGVQTLCLVEHAFQLYFPDKHTAMGFAWQSNPEMVEAAWNTPGRGRMEAYQRFASQLRPLGVKIGLELDLYGEGELLLHDEDEKFGWDVLIGAVHQISGFERGKTTQSQAEELFMREITSLVSYNIQILAHPFRFFAKNGLKAPVDLYPEIAGLLSDNNVCAEVNFHNFNFPANRFSPYHPDPEFFKLCVDKGVKLAFASDAHELAEVGEFWPHVHALKQVGITSKSFAQCLFSLNKTN